MLSWLLLHWGLRLWWLRWHFLMSKLLLWLFRWLNLFLLFTFLFLFSYLYLMFHLFCLLDNNTLLWNWNDFLLLKDFICLLGRHALQSLNFDLFKFIWVSFLFLLTFSFSLSHWTASVFLRVWKCLLLKLFNLHLLGILLLERLQSSIFIYFLSYWLFVVNEWIVI